MNDVFRKEEGLNYGLLARALPVAVGERNYPLKTAMVDGPITHHVDSMVTGSEIIRELLEAAQFQVDAAYDGPGFERGREDMFTSYSVLVRTAESKGAILFIVRDDGMTSKIVYTDFQNDQKIPADGVDSDALLEAILKSAFPTMPHAAQEHSVQDLARIIASNHQAQVGEALAV